MRTDRGSTDRGYGVIAYLVMAGVVLLILAGGFLLVRMITDSLSAPAPTSSTVAQIEECAGNTVFDADTASCVPKAVCELGEVYQEDTNTCVVPPPVVQSVAPSSGLTSGGTEVRITGSGFAPGASVLIDGVPAIDVAVVNETTITAVTPGSPNLYPVDVEVTNPEGEPAVLENAFTYVALPVEQVKQVVPEQGSKDGGEAVIIKGVDFVDGAVVAFGGRPATDVQVLNPTTIRAITPLGSLGPVTVNVRNPGEDPYALEDGFTYVDQPPRVVIIVRPAKGAQAGGTKITIAGTGFAEGAAVTVGGQKARKVKVVDSTRITAVTPPGELGPANVAVRNPDLPAAILEDAFEYVEAPTVTEITPVTGAEGTKVTITGTGFLDGATVSFGATPATDVKVVNDTTITVVAPAGEVDAVVPVIVANPEQPPATLKKAFTYGKAEGDTAAGGGQQPQPTPKPKPKPTANPLPACTSFRLPDSLGPVGGQVTFTASDLFPGSRGIANPVLAGAEFVGDSGDTSDGSITWQSSPAQITWNVGSQAGAGGVILFSYTASSCSGTGTGVNKYVSAR